MMDCYEWYRSRHARRYASVSGGRKSYCSQRSLQIACKRGTIQLRFTLGL
jgi:hypothetical protein